MVDRLFAQTNLRLRDIDLFAVASGPGSFTGIRVGLSAAKAWAKALDRPVQGVSVLEAMVEEARPETDLAVPILDARRGEFFLRLFQRPPLPAGNGASGFRPEGEGLALNPESLKLFLAEFRGENNSRSKITCLVREHDRSAQALRAVLPEFLRWQTVSGNLVPAITRLALRAYYRGEAQGPTRLDACYIRRSDAELKWRE